ncbi:unnamed protein product, partial [Ectocarpus sp. 8 AP-2014]
SQKPVSYSAQLRNKGGKNSIRCETGAVSTTSKKVSGTKNEDRWSLRPQAGVHVVYFRFYVKHLSTDEMKLLRYTSVRRCVTIQLSVAHTGHERAVGVIHREHVHH